MKKLGNYYKVQRLLLPVKRLKQHRVKLSVLKSVDSLEIMSKAEVWPITQESSVGT